MSEEKIIIEFTKEQLENIKLMLDKTTADSENYNLVKDSLPKEFRSKPSYSIPNKIDVDFLIRKGSIGDCGRYGSSEFLSFFKKVAKKHPKVASKYIEMMFLPSQKRSFTFSSYVRKEVAAIGLEQNILPDVAKLYYVRSYASSGTNKQWVLSYLNKGNVPSKAWDILAASKRFEVISYVIENGPENILPLVLVSIPKVKKTSSYSVYDYNKGSDCSSEYLAYLFEHRTLLINKR